MSLNFVSNPYSYYNNRKKTGPLFKGFIYVGEPDLNPKIEANRKEVTAKQEDGNKVPISQPIRTNSGGYAVDTSGNVVVLLVDGNYSIRVEDKGENLALEQSNVNDGVPVTFEDNPVLFADEPVLNRITVAALKADSDIEVGQTVITTSYYSDNLLGGGIYDTVLTSSVIPNDLDIITSTATPTLSFVLRIGDFIFADQVGASFDGTMNDSPAWNRCMDLFKLSGKTIIGGTGNTACEDTILYDTSGEGITRGLIFEGPGPKALTFINKNAAGGALFELTSGTSAGDFQFGGSLSGFRIVQSGSGANSHGITYKGTWRQKFYEIEGDSLNGSFIKALNPIGDVDSSAFVDMNFVRANDCVGPGYDSDGGTGGIAAHTLSNYHFENCGGSDGNVILDGVGNFRVNKSTIVGNPAGSLYIPTQTGIHIKNTNITPSNIDIEEGEFGNSLKKVILIDAGLRITMGGFRIVKRVGEDTLTEGIEIADGVSSAQHITINPIVVSFDHSTPTTTLFKIGTGIDDNLTIKSPVLNTFTAGNEYIEFTGTAKDKASYIENSSGRVLFSKALSRNSVIEATATSLTVDLTVANWNVFRISDLGSPYTLAVPLNGAANGASTEISIQNISGAGTPTMNFDSGINDGGYVNPGIGLTTTATYRFNSDDDVWRVAGGGWSTPSA